MIKNLPGDISGGPVVKLLPSNAEGMSSIPGQGVKIPYASWPKKQNIKQKQYCNKFSKDLKKRERKSICNAGDPGSIPGSGRYSGVGNVNPL